jgi:signal transduction histidine kinase
VTLRVSDHGRGLGEGALQRTGVAGMRERALLAGGDFSMATRSDGGVEVVLQLP